MKINYKQVGQNIHDLRIQLGLSQAELAEHADISPTYMSMIENATKQISLETIYRIGHELGVTVSQLLGEETDSYQPVMLWNVYYLYIHSSPFEKQLILDLIITIKKRFNVMNT